MRIFFTIVIVFLILFVISFSLQNATLVPLRYYDILDTELPAYTLMFIAFLAGIIFTGLLGLAERLNLTKTIRELNKIVRDLRRELRSQEVYQNDDTKEKLPLKEKEG